MKLMDKQGRFFGKVHFFDLLIILLLIFGIGGMALRSANPKAPANQTVSATYTFEIQEVYQYMTEAVAIGDTLYEKGVPMGTVTGMAVTPHSTLRKLEDGTLKEAEHVMLYDIMLTVKTDQLIAQDGYYIGTQEILNGTGHTFQNGFATMTGTVRELTPIQ